MRWIEEALQRGRDPDSDSDTLISIRTLRESVSYSHPQNGLTIRRGEASHIAVMVVVSPSRRSEATCSYSRDRLWW